MLVPNVHRAIENIREIKQRIIDRQLFRGYSGRARIAGGFLAVLAAAVLSHSSFPSDAQKHLFVWGILCIIAFSVNLGGLLFWYISRPAQARSLDDLHPVIDVVPPLIVGGLISLAIIEFGALDILFGVWMCLYGLMNVASRHTLPRSTWHLGWYYILCGGIYLLVWPERTILNPWPMAAVFFIGECIGGSTFSRIKQQNDEEDS